MHAPPMPIRHAYLHGFASSQLSTKGQALKAFYASCDAELLTPNLNKPSFAELSYTGMLAAVDELDAREAAGPEDRWRFVGSSMGGYIAARWAELHPERVDRLILLCPAFDFVARWPTMIGEAAFERWREEGSFLLPNYVGEPEAVHWGLVEDAMNNHPARPQIPSSCPTLIIHGRRDDIVPIESSRRYAEAHGHVELLEVDDDHTLAASLPTISTRAQTFLLNPSHTLSWDYFGPDAGGTAEHFKAHLDEFLAREGITGCSTGVEQLEPGRHAATWCRCPEDRIVSIGRALRPHRVD